LCPDNYGNIDIFFFIWGFHKIRQHGSSNEATTVDPGGPLSLHIFCVTHEIQCCISICLLLCPKILHMEKVWILMFQNIVTDI